MLFSAEYDEHIEYRIAEALRNFAQHRALPTHSMTWPTSWVDHDTESRRLRFGIIPGITVDELKAEGGFKASVLAELEESGEERFSLTIVLRRYIESLTKVHVEVRAAIQDRIEQARAVVSEYLERAGAEFGDNLIGLVVSKNTDPDTDEHHYVNLKSWTRRQFLIRKNSSFEKLSRRYVASEHPRDL